MFLLEQQRIPSGNDFQYWRKQAEVYDRATASIIGQKGQKDASKWLANLLKPSDNVLEFGCGTAFYSEALAGRVNRLVVTDMAHEMLSIAKARLASFSNVEVIQADVMHSEFNSRRFQVVFLGNLLHIVQEPQMALSKCLSLLETGGRLLAIDYSNDGLSPVQKLAMGLRYLRMFGVPPKANKSYRLPDLAGLVEQAGFEIIDSCQIVDRASILCIHAVKT